MTRREPLRLGDAKRAVASASGGDKEVADDGMTDKSKRSVEGQRRSKEGPESESGSADVDVDVEGMQELRPVEKKSSSRKQGRHATDRRRNEHQSANSGGGF